MIIIDTREKPKAIKSITDYFDRNGIEYMRSKLIAGDYMDFGNPSVIVDRKQTIAELAKNCTIEKGRFLAEIHRARCLGVDLVILVEQSRYKSGDRWITVNTIWDLYLWSNKYSTIRGEEIMRTLAYWTNKYPFRVEFCDRRTTGKRIIELLEVKK